jgi:hypothetical protein
VTAIMRSAHAMRLCQVIMASRTEHRRAASLDL